MLKRLFWLALAALIGWLAWQWFRQRDANSGHIAPQFAPPRPFERPSAPGAAPVHEPSVAAQPDAPGQTEATGLESADEVSERVAGAAEGAAPEEEAMPDEEEAGGTRPSPVAVSGVAVTTASENERATIEDSGAAAPSDAQTLGREVIGYCVRCKTKRPIQGAHEETTETGRRAARGTCPVCGASMFTFLKDDE